MHFLQKLPVIHRKIKSGKLFPLATKVHWLRHTGFADGQVRASMREKCLIHSKSGPLLLLLLLLKYRTIEEQPRRFGAAKNRVFFIRLPSAMFQDMKTDFFSFAELHFLDEGASNYGFLVKTWGQVGHNCLLIHRKPQLPPVVPVARTAGTGLRPQGSKPCKPLFFKDKPYLSTKKGRLYYYDYVFIEYFYRRIC